jgi:hypothetical protein
MNRAFREVLITAVALLPLSLASCYAHYAWIAVEAPQSDAESADVSAATFSEAEAAAAVQVAVKITRSLGLEFSRMNRLPAPEPTPEDPFRRLALFQGSGENDNLLLTVAIRDDGSIIRCWISDLDHPRETELASELLEALKAELGRAFPNRTIRVGDGRKLRIFAG